MPTILYRIFGIETRKDFYEKVDAEEREEQKTLIGKMKPDDGITGYMHEHHRTVGEVIAIDLAKFLDIYKCDRKTNGDVPNRKQIWSCAKAFRDNNNAFLMVSISLDREGSVHLVDGYHRLELMRQGMTSKPVVLVNVLNEDQYSEEEYQASIEKIKERCGADNVQITQHKEVVFCAVEYDGHLPYRFEQKTVAPYYTLTHI